MKNVLSPLLRAGVFTALATLGMVQTSWAQNTAADAATFAPAPATKAAATESAIQRIRTEDAGSRIDELRVGGETQSITVQPKTGADMPAYEIKRAEGAKGTAPSSISGDTNGTRVWNFFKF
jgi:hypothetical protein